MILERLVAARAWMADKPESLFDMQSWQVFDESKFVRPVKNDEGDTISFVLYSEMEQAGFACGTAGCIGGLLEIYVNRRTLAEYQVDRNILYVTAAEYLELTPDETSMLFYQYPTHPGPFKTWKNWMLARIDAIIRDGGKVEPYYKVFPSNNSDGQLIQPSTENR